MERVLTSTTVRKVWTAAVSGWNLTFTHESNGTAGTIHCNGFKPTEGSQPPMQSASVNAHLNIANNASGINFNGIGHDSTLAAAIIAEMETIATEEEA